MRIGTNAILRQISSFKAPLYLKGMKGKVDIVQNKATLVFSCTKMPFVCHVEFHFAILQYKILIRIHSFILARCDLVKIVKKLK